MQGSKDPGAIFAPDTTVVSTGLGHTLPGTALLGPESSVVGGPPARPTLTQTCSGLTEERL